MTARPAETGGAEPFLRPRSGSVQAGAGRQLCPAEGAQAAMEVRKAGFTGIKWDSPGQTEIHWDKMRFAGMKWDSPGQGGIGEIRRDEAGFSGTMRDSAAHAADP